MNQHLSFIDSGKAGGGKAKVRTGLVMWRRILCGAKTLTNCLN